MRNLCKTFTCAILFLAVTLIPSVMNAGCTQSHTACEEGFGVYLICRTPYQVKDCYAGGCSAPVIVANICPEPGKDEK